MAFVIKNLAGFDTQGASEYDAITGSPTYETTNARTVANGGLGAAIVIASGQEVLLGSGSSASDEYLRTSFAFRAPTAFTSGDRLAYIGESSSIAIAEITVVDVSGSKYLRCLDNNGATIGTGSTALSTGTWYHVEVIIYRDTTAGTLNLRLDGAGSDEISGSSLDTQGVLDIYNRVVLGDSVNNTSTYWFDDWVTSGSSTSDSTFLGLSEVLTYQTDQTGTSADAGLTNAGTSGGDALGVGTWPNVAETPGNDSNLATYDGSNTAGAVDLDAHSSDTDGDSNIKALKGIWRLSRGNGGGTTHYIGLGDSDDTNVPDQTVTLSPDPAFKTWLKTTGLPTDAQTITQGFGTGGAQDANCYEMWASLLHVPDAGGHTGTGAQSLALFTQSGVGVMQPEGSGAQSLATLSQAGTGAQEFTGTGAQTAAALTQSGVGVEEFTGTGAQSLATLAQDGSGSHVLSFTGTGAQTLAQPSQAGVGVEEFTGTGAQSLATLAQTGTGLMHPEGTGAQTLATLAQSGAGLEEFIGTGAQSVATLTQAGTGSHVQTFTATGAQTLATLAQAAAGLEEFIATGAQTAATLTQSGTGVMQPEGSGAQTLESVTQAGVGYTASFIGSGAQTLATLAQAAAGLEEFIATGAQAFEALAQAGTGTSFVPPVGSGAQTLETLAQAGVAVETIEATGAQTAATLSQSASGVLTVSGTADQLLQSLIQSAVGVESFTSTGASLLAELQQSAASEAPTVGVGAQALQRLTQYTEEILETRPDWEVGATWVALTSGAGWQDDNAAAAAWAAETSSAEWRGDNEAAATFGSHSANSEFR